MGEARQTRRFRFWLWLVRVIGVIVPRRLRADWKQEWKAELRYRELLLADWDKLNWRTKLDLLRRSLGAFWDALLLQPQRLEDEVFQDLRYGARMLLKNRAFTLVAVFTLALGIGANTAIFSVVNGVLLRPLPFKDQDRLAILWTANTKQRLPDGTSYPNFKDWRDQNHVFEDLAVFHRPQFTSVILTGADGPERIEAGLVSANFFSLLGVPPALGRTFSSDEEVHHDSVVVLSHGLWERWFGASLDVIGQTLDVFYPRERDESNSRKRLQVIGVMPAQFQFPNKETQLWIPHDRHQQVRDADSLVVLGRLKPKANFREAQAEMDTIASRLEQQYPDSNAGLGVNVVPLLVEINGNNVQLALWVLFGAVVFVLLIACTNVANLFLARGATREREFALRTALGAGRARLIRQLLTESAALSLVAGLLGLLFACVGMRALILFGRRSIPRLAEVSLDARVLTFTLGISLLAGILFGLTPGLKLSRLDPNESLKEGGRSGSGGAGSQRTRGWLVVLEFAMAVMLLCDAGLLVRSFVAIQAVAPGFRTERVLLMRINLPRSRYGGNGDPRTESFYQQALERINALPGVQATGAIGDFFIEHNPDLTVVVEGHPPVTPDQPIPPLTSSGISSGYFQTMGVPLLRGRFLSDQDRGQGSPRVVIINEAMARNFWPGEDPIGKRFKQSGTSPWRTVVGVVGDMRQQGQEKEPVPQFFDLGWAIGMDLVVGTTSDPLPLAASVRSTVHSIDQTLPTFGITTVEQRLSEFNSPRRFETWLLSLFSAIALLLAMIGIYGLMHYSVAQRTHEIGIRIALGAQASDVLCLVIRQGIVLALIGVTLGIAGALWLTRTVSSLLYGVTATDPVTFTGAPLLLLSMALLACYIPARKAMKVDPMVALRHE